MDHLMHKVQQKYSETTSIANNLLGALGVEVPACQTPEQTPVCNDKPQFKNPDLAQPTLTFLQTIASLNFLDEMQTGKLHRLIYLFETEIKRQNDNYESRDLLVSGIVGQTTSLINGNDTLLGWTGIKAMTKRLKWDQGVKFIVIAEEGAITHEDKMNMLHSAIADVFFVKRPQPKSITQETKPELTNKSEADIEKQFDTWWTENMHRYWEGSTYRRLAWQTWKHLSIERKVKPNLVVQDTQNTLPQQELLDVDVIVVRNLGLPNKNGNTYTDENFKPFLGKSYYGQIGFPEYKGNIEKLKDNIEKLSTLDLRKVSHQIQNIRIVNGNVVGSLKILDTTNGNILRSLIKQNNGSGFAMRAITTMHDSQVKVIEIVAFDYVSNPA
jgi:hypothetical protein